MKKYVLLFVFHASFFGIFAQKISLQRVEPPNWWTDMKNPDFMLMVYGENIARTDVEIKSKQVKFKSSTRTENPNYLFIHLSVIPGAEPGVFDIRFTQNGKEKANYSYRIDKREVRTRGFSPADLVYLLMPDRFVNGDPANDNYPGVLEQANRTNSDGRHGGDIKGIVENLDYIKNLGMTAVWFNPFVDNNISKYAYHGYAATDFYAIDPRFGSLNDYIKLADKMHAVDLKIIQDMVFNHCASEHWWMKDLPADDWLNHNQNFRTSYRAATVADPYVSDSDREQFNSGWFVETMPDLNQKNHLLAEYLILNSIWWTEIADLDGIRTDTHAYPDPDFMSDWASRIKQEYPDITLLGETWLPYIPYTAFFSGNSPVSGSYNTHLDCITDFPLRYAFEEAFKEAEGWKNGLARFYYTFGQDFLYGNAYNNVTFLDNHDISRIFSVNEKNYDYHKMGIAILLTARGIPVWYYGTEYASDGHEHDGHGAIRKDFPGGWQGDSKNMFTRKGMATEELEIYDYSKKIALWRKTNEAVKFGKFKHFVPDNHVYVYFRYTENSAVMTIVNNHASESRTVSGTRFKEVLNHYKKAKEITTDTQISDLSNFTIPPKTVHIYELQR